jgi:hypothetical protein
MGRPRKADQTLEQRLEAVEMFFNRKIRRPKTIIDYLVANFQVDERTAKRDIETVKKRRRTPLSDEDIISDLTETLHEYDALYQKEILKGADADDNKLLRITEKRNKLLLELKKMGGTRDADIGSRTTASDALRKFHGSYNRTPESKETQ